MNVIEKILAKASGRKEVAPGEVIIANVDLMVMHDLSANFVMRVFREELDGGTILDPSRIAIVFDHNFSPATEEAARTLHKVRRFAAEHGIRNLFNGGNGSLHHVIIENGLWAPGQVIIGCDSHTPVYGALGVFATGVGNNSMAALGFQHGKAWFRIPSTMQVFLHGKTRGTVAPRDVAQYVVGHLGEDSAIYRALEYAGPYVEQLSIEDRMLFPLMSIDLGAKASFINPDEKTAAYARAFSKIKDFEMFTNDANAKYERIVDIDVSQLEPQVACPPTVGNVKGLSEVEGTHIDLAEIGGSTGGRLDDLRVAAGILKGCRIDPGVRLQVVPANRSVYKAALQEGLIEALHDAGAVIFPPSAGSNQAVNMGAMSEEEVMISNQARNFPGRNGHPKAKHYLGSARTVASSALNGKISG
ncbi:MAG TPA: aconitase/3-isopropylmalate dehydratase large subunit family protein [Terriglobia bacterium]|jgi:3-isopropylmalate/(R)-2-methylmalate dehydratase large subunit